MRGSAAVARIPFVAGIDRYLPPVFARMHPRWNSPVAALLTQTAFAALFIVLGQSGTSVKGAYDVVVEFDGHRDDDPVSLSLCLSVEVKR